jgi:hypothetical protein
MKKYIHYPLLLISMFLILQSCKKPHDTRYVTLNETIVSGNTYTLDLSAYGDGDDKASITTQAKNYTVSQISKDAVSSNDIYTFSVTQKQADKETVIITLKEDHRHGPSGGGCDHDEAVITINFTIN